MLDLIVKDYCDVRTEWYLAFVAQFNVLAGF
jgi:hypothetical protein